MKKLYEEGGVVSYNKACTGIAAESCKAMGMRQEFTDWHFPVPVDYAFEVCLPANNDATGRGECSPSQTVCFAVTGYRPR